MTKPPSPSERYQLVREDRAQRYGITLDYWNAASDWWDALPTEVKKSYEAAIYARRKKYNKPLFLVVYMFGV